MNALKKRIRDNNFVSVMWCTTGSLHSVGAAWKNGEYDLVLVDAEHHPGMNLERLINLRHCFMAMQAQETKPVEFGVRVPETTRTWLQHLTDGGVRSFVMPMVDTAEQARRAVSLVLYPPDGVRGGAGHMPCNAFGADKDYHTKANANSVVIVQCETPMALANLEEIANVPGVDMIFVGPFDMHITHGKGFRTGDEELEAIIQRRIKETVVSVPTARFGIMEPRTAMIRRWRDYGFNLFAVPDVVLIDRAFTERSNELAPLRD